MFAMLGKILMGGPSECEYGVFKFESRLEYDGEEMIKKEKPNLLRLYDKYIELKGTEVDRLIEIIKLFGEFHALYADDKRIMRKLIEGTEFADE